LKSASCNLQAEQSFGAVAGAVKKMKSKEGLSVLLFIRTFAPAFAPPLK
jgi:hypothetical protein